MPIVKKCCFWAAILLTGAVAALADTLPAIPSAAAISKTQVDYYRGNIGHTGVATESLVAPLSVLWRHTTSLAKNNPASPVYGAATVYFPSAGALYALNAVDGTTKWQYPADSKAHAYFASTPALSGGFLYVTDDDGQAYKIEAATGKEVWTAKLEGAIRSAPVLSEGLVFFGSGNDHCYALSADTGQVVWDQPTGGSITTSPTITGGLVVFASADNNIYSLNVRTGKKAWSVAFDADPSVAPLVFDGREIYVTAGDTVYGLDPGNGTRRSKIQLPTTVLVPPTISSDSVYVVTQANVLYALTSAGHEKWRVTLDGAETAPPLLAGNMLLAATQPGVVSGYETGSGKLVWRYVMQASATDSQPKYPTANVFAAPIVADGTLYIVSDDGSLTAFRKDAPDAVAPQMSQLVPETGATVRGDNLTYGALIVDDGTGINPATVRLLVDGEEDTQAKYHAGQNAVYNMPTTPLKEGTHELTVKASDWRGNAVSQTWSFTISDQAQGPGRFGPPGFSPFGPGYPGGGGRNPYAPPPPPPIAGF
jgi:outer membrane protein assembly factor BamB